jgi:hypothetical protein
VARGAHADAVACYSGAFLDSFQLQGAPEFARWVEAERDRIDRQYVDALEALARQASAEGRHDDEVAWRRRHASADPFSSRAALGLLRALDDAGDRPGALEYAAIYENLIRQHLEAEPDPAVLQFVAALRENPGRAALVRVPSARLQSTNAESSGSAEFAVSIESATSAPSAQMAPAAPRYSSRHWLAAAVLIATLGIVVAGSRLGGHAASPALDSIVVVGSGTMSVAGRDTATRLISCSGAACPPGPFPQHPFVVPPHPSYTRPATGTSYILQVADGSTIKSPGYACCTTAVFENEFRIPAGAVSATVSIDLLADNRATVSVNGVEFGRQKSELGQENFTEGSSFTTTFVPDPTGVNHLQVTLWDGGGVMGLNYRAIVTWEAGRESTSETSEPENAEITQK